MNGAGGPDGGRPRGRTDEGELTAWAAGKMESKASRMLCLNMKHQIRVLLNFVGMDDGWIQGRYTVDARRILHRIIHTISMLYLYVV